MEQHDVYFHGKNLLKEDLIGAEDFFADESSQQIVKAMNLGCLPSTVSPAQNLVPNDSATQRIFRITQLFF